MITTRNPAPEYHNVLLGMSIRNEQKGNMQKEMKSNNYDVSSLRHETEPGCEAMPKRPYSAMTITRFEVEFGTPILAGSVVDNSMIISVGQEVGPSYDLSTDIDSNTGKTFIHEWE